MSDKKPTTTDAVYEWLGTNPGFHSLDDLTTALPQVKKPTLAKALTALVNDGQIRSTDLDGNLVWTAEPDPDADTEAEEVNDHGPGVHDDQSLVSDEDTEAAPVPAGPDVRVIGIAFVLSRTTTGLTASQVATGSGLPVDSVWPVLAAMHTAAAAVCDREFILDPDATWVAGETDPTTVNLEAAPDTVKCPMCGNPAPVPGRKATRKRSNGDGSGSRVTGQYEPVRNMAAQVEQWLKRHPDQDVTPGGISRALKEATSHPNPNAYSSGAISNVLNKLVRDGKLHTVPDAKQITFRTPAAESSG